MGKLILVTGGAKSGKSLSAKRLVSSLGEHVVYVATAEAFADPEMSERIERHQARRPATWTTVEAPYDLRPALVVVPDAVDAILIDCLTLWASNRLLALGDPDDPDWWSSVGVLERALIEETEALLSAARAVRWPLVLVTNEAGYGVVPSTPLGRAFRDLLGAVTQRVAALSDAVFLVVAGIGMELKRQAIDAWKHAQTVKSINMSVVCACR
jgi:adenosylcobinamide kinase / adenosylcobinamide-phosphate guanylyltransferase